MDITTIILIILGVVAGVGFAIFSWRFENVGNVSNEDSQKDSEGKE